MFSGTLTRFEHFMRFHHRLKNNEETVLENPYVKLHLPRLHDIKNIEMQNFINYCDGNY